MQVFVMKKEIPTAEYQKDSIYEAIKGMLNSYSKHQRICNILGVGRYVISEVAHYALMAKNISVLHNSAGYNYGGWIECYKCNEVVASNFYRCPKCSSKEIPNYKRPYYVSTYDDLVEKGYYCG